MKFKYTANRLTGRPDEVTLIPTDAVGELFLKFLVDMIKAGERGSSITLRCNARQLKKKWILLNRIP